MRFLSPKPDRGVSEKFLSVSGSGRFALGYSFESILLRMGIPDYLLNLGFDPNQRQKLIHSNQQ